MLLSLSCLVQNANLIFSAILSDVTSPETRSKALAHVGIAFAICFCIGPPIGAYFASRPLPKSMNSLGLDLNVYAVPAFLTLVLLVVETAFLLVALPETRGRKRISASQEKPKAPVHENGNGKHSSGPLKPVSKRTVQSRIGVLKALRRLHFFFLAIFSGVEFTLTFLTFDCKFLFFFFFFWLNILIRSHSTGLV